MVGRFPSEPPTGPLPYLPFPTDPRCSFRTWHPLPSSPAQRKSCFRKASATSGAGSCPSSVSPAPWPAGWTSASPRQLSWLLLLHRTGALQRLHLKAPAHQLRQARPHELGPLRKLPACHPAMGWRALPLQGAASPRELQCPDAHKGSPPPGPCGSPALHLRRFGLCCCGKCTTHYLAMPLQRRPGAPSAPPCVHNQQRSATLCCPGRPSR
mmetsp:Transcript_38889/g.72307  ORF Transcript_38889/g.72307 Transcript_38889/m.72307 type:complete len:211 (+) Transcript_38889:120-752(+)